MRRFSRVLTALALALALALPVPRAEAATRFPDVGTDHWAYGYILTCYEAGLMQGNDKGLFLPEKSLTLAEAATVAARLHIQQHGTGVTLATSDPWYQSAVNYVATYGLLPMEELRDPEQPAARAQVAGLFANVLTYESYTFLNSVTSLPDVDGSTPHSESIFLLYDAGILTGSDRVGTFHPYDSITRDALSAILCRIIRPETRVTLAFAHEGESEVGEPVETGEFLETAAVTLTSETLAAALAGNHLAMVTFGASWCPDCQRFAPTLDALAQWAQGQEGGPLIGAVDVDAETALALSYNIERFPTQIFFRDGVEYARNVEEEHPLDYYIDLLTAGQ